MTRILLFYICTTRVYVWTKKQERIIMATKKLVVIKVVVGGETVYEQELTLQEFSTKSKGYNVSGRADINGNPAMVNGNLVFTHSKDKPLSNYQ